MHLLAEDIEALKLIDGLLRRIDAVIYHECLALPLDALLRDHINYVAVLGEQPPKSLDQERDFNSLIEVAHIYPRSR